MHTPHTDPNYTRITTITPHDPSGALQQQPYNPETDLVCVGCLDCELFRKDLTDYPEAQQYLIDGIWTNMDDIDEAMDAQEHAHLKSNRHHGSVIGVIDNTYLPQREPMLYSKALTYHKQVASLTNEELEIYTAYLVDITEDQFTSVNGDVASSKDCLQRYVGRYASIEDYAVEYAFNTDMFSKIAGGSVAQRYQKAMQMLDWSDYAALVRQTVDIADAGNGEIYIFAKAD